MGIYRNENVNSLPEQVQENKENIKQINEILENIDPEQVATILSDIQALKAEQVVQNTAIGTNTTNIGNNTTAINNEKTAREGLIDLDASGNTQVKSATGKNAGVVSDTAIFVDSGDSGIAVLNTGITLTTDKEDDAHQVSFNNSGDFQVSNGHQLSFNNSGAFQVSNGHVLKFDNTGAITIDGQPIGGGGGGVQLYRHCINVSVSGYKFSFDIISQSSTPFETKVQLRDYLVNNYFTSTNQFLSATGYKQAGGPIFGIYSVGGNNLAVYFFNVNASSFDPDNVYGLVMNITDVVITL